MSVAEAGLPAPVDAGLTLKSGISLEFRESPANADGSDTPDTATINSAFLRGLRESSYTNGLPSDAFFAVGRQAWNGIRRDFVTTIAHAAGKPGEIAGFITHAEFHDVKTGHRTKVLAWIYVAKPWRRFGVARALLEEAGIARGERFVAMFASPEKMSLARTKGLRPAFTPFLVWRYLTTDGGTVPPRGAAA